MSGGIQLDSSIPSGIPGGIPQTPTREVGKTGNGQSVSVLQEVTPKVPRSGKPSNLPTTDLTARKPSIPNDPSSLPSLQSKESESSQETQPFDEVLQEKVPRSFKKKLADAARKLKSKTYGDLKRWLLGQKHKPMPQGLIDRISYDGKMQGMATERNQMLATLTELKQELRNLKDELSSHEKGSPRYQEIKAQLKSIPEDRERLKEDIAAINQEMTDDLPRFAKVEKQVKGL